MGMGFIIAVIYVASRGIFFLQQRLRMSQQKSAFTIIEILIVIAVISIIIGIAVPRMRGMQEESMIAKAKGELKTLQTAIESYYYNQSPSAYPAPPNARSLCLSVLNQASPLIVSERLFDPFYSTTGGCSPNNNEYLYYKSSNDRYYVVFSRGLDRAADITGISDAGVLQGVNDDDIYATNGTGF